MIPDKHLFIVTSTIHATMGVVDNQTRFKQTIDTLQSLRKYVPDAIIVLAESSQGKELSHEEISEISKYRSEERL
jgi:hypothetical protein